MFESVLSTILNTSFEAKGQLKVNKIIKIDIFCWTNDQEDIVKYLFFFLLFSLLFQCHSFRYHLDPSGTFLQYDAKAIGKNVLKTISRNYKPLNAWR